MDLQKLVDTIAHNRKPISAVFLIIGIAVILTTAISTVGMILMLLGLIGMFWENIVAGSGK